MPIQFLRPDLAIWFALLPVISLCWLIHQKAKNRFRQQAGYGASLAMVSRLSTSKHDVVLLTAALLVTVALVLAIMRPQVFIDRLLPEYERQDLILILDRSASMYATDVTPSRFVRAIQEIKTFMGEKPAEIDRVSLVGFAGTAITLSYLTRDLDTLFFFLDWIEEDTRVYFGTDLTEALTNALELVNKDEQLQKDAADSRKIFLVLSDGDDQGEKLAGMLNRLQQQHIRVHTIGIGSDSAVPIPVVQEDGMTQYLEDDQGNPLTTHFDESTLRMVSDMTGGRFFRSTTGHELAGFINQIVQQEKRQTGWKRSEDYMELYLPLLLLAATASLLLLVKA